jgi:hypothetical protein
MNTAQSTAHVLVLLLGNVAEKREMVSQAVKGVDVSQTIKRERMAHAAARRMPG